MKLRNKSVFLCGGQVEALLPKTVVLKEVKGNTF